MSDEYTITLTVREENGGVAINQRAELDDGDTPAAKTARALNEWIDVGLRRISTHSAERNHKPSKTLH